MADTQTAMNVTATSIPEVLIVEPKIFGDARGFFMETYQAERYAANGIGARFVQDNLSRSARGVLRGLHIQNPRPQGKLVTREVTHVVAHIDVNPLPRFGRHNEIRDPGQVFWGNVQLLVQRQSSNRRAEL